MAEEIDYGHLSKVALRVALPMVGNSKDAADVAQDVMEVLARDPGRWDQPEAFVVTAAKNRATDLLRKKQHQAGRESLSRLFDDEGREESTPVRSRQRFSNEVALWDAVRSLDPKLADVVIRSLAGFDAKEIAAALGLAHGTVRNRLVEARKQLRDKLGDSAGRLLP